MDKYRVKLSQRAFRDIENIYDYIARELHSPANAKNQTDRIKGAVKSLDSFPQAYQERQVGRFANQGYRQLLIDNYMAVFRIDEDEKTVYVITVQYQGRNI